MKVIVIGAGAGGLFFAAQASLSGHEVIILEGNEKCGKKLFITGKGRCNVTNDCDEKTFFENVIRNPKFLYSSYSRWNSQDTINYFNSHSCPLVTERGNRVFPASYKAYDITDTLVRECRKNGVEIHLNCLVTDVKKKEDKFIVKTIKGVFEADKLVIATGGKSYPLTGSKGDGYKFASSFGHTIIPPKGALCPLKVKDNFSKNMLGFTLKNVTLHAYNDKFDHKEFGDLEFLTSALTGPIALTTSSLINDKQNIKLELDFKPALNNEVLDGRLLREIKANPNGKVMDLIHKLFPSFIIPLFVARLKVDSFKTLNNLTKEERDEIIHLIKNFPFEFVSLDDIEKGIVTSGGVSVKEISPSSMESKIVKGLYFAGEVIDVDALTGGFNIQIAFTTAYAAATSLYED